MIAAITGSYRPKTGKGAYLSEANTQPQDPEQVNEGDIPITDPAPVDPPDNESLPGDPSTTPADY